MPSNDDSWSDVISPSAHQRCRSGTHGRRQWTAKLSGYLINGAVDLGSKAQRSFAICVDVFLWKMVTRPTSARITRRQNSVLSATWNFSEIFIISWKNYLHVEPSTGLSTGVDQSTIVEGKPKYCGGKVLITDEHVPGLPSSLRILAWVDGKILRKFIGSWAERLFYNNYAYFGTDVL